MYRSSSGTSRCRSGSSNSSSRAGSSSQPVASGREAERWSVCANARTVRGLPRDSRRWSRSLFAPTFRRLAVKAARASVARRRGARRRSIGRNWTSDQPSLPMFGEERGPRATTAPANSACHKHSSRWRNASPVIAIRGVGLCSTGALAADSRRAATPRDHRRSGRQRTHADGQSHPP